MKGQVVASVYIVLHVIIIIIFILCNATSNTVLSALQKNIQKICLK